MNGSSYYKGWPGILCFIEVLPRAMRNLYNLFVLSRFNCSRSPPYLPSSLQSGVYQINLQPPPKNFKPVFMVMLVTGIHSYKSFKEVEVRLWTHNKTIYKPLIFQSFFWAFLRHQYFDNINNTGVVLNSTPVSHSTFSYFWTRPKRPDVNKWAVLLLYLKVLLTSNNFLQGTLSYFT